MRQSLWLCGVATSICIATATPAGADDAPKYGGTLTYMIPAESPPSFDAQREETFATIHSATHAWCMAGERRLGRSVALGVL